jgi:hypothetical protein
VRKEAAMKSLEVGCELVLILAGAVSYGTVTFQKKTGVLKYW